MPSAYPVPSVVCRSSTPLAFLPSSCSPGSSLSLQCTTCNCSPFKPVNRLWFACKVQCRDVEYRLQTVATSLVVTAEHHVVKTVMVEGTRTGIGVGVGVGKDVGSCVGVATSEACMSPGSGASRCARTTPPLHPNKQAQHPSRTSTVARCFCADERGTSELR